MRSSQGNGHVSGNGYMERGKVPRIQALRTGAFLESGLCRLVRASSARRIAHRQSQRPGQFGMLTRRSGTLLRGIWPGRDRLSVSSHAVQSRCQPVSLGPCGSPGPPPAPYWFSRRGGNDAAGGTDSLSNMPPAPGVTTLLARSFRRTGRGDACAADRKAAGKSCQP